MKAQKILFITQEISPFLVDTPYSIFGKELPESFLEKSREIRTFMPKWGEVNERRNMLHEVIRLSGINLIINDSDHPLLIKVASVPVSRLQVYFIDNDDYFHKRHMLLDNKGKEYKDNAERAVFYARGVLETMKKLRWVPDIVFCQGWISSIVPLYIKTAYSEEPSFRDCRVIYMPLEGGPVATLPKNFPDVLQYRSANIDACKSLGPKMTMQSLQKLGMLYADSITLYEPNEEIQAYAKKIKKPVFVRPEEIDLKTSFHEYIDSVWSFGKPEDDEED